MMMMMISVDQMIFVIYWLIFKSGKCTVLCVFVHKLSFTFAGLQWAWKRRVWNVWIVARWQRILQAAYTDCQMSRRECTSLLKTSWKQSASSWIENCLRSDQKDIRCRWIIPSKRSSWNHREKPVYSHKYSCIKKSLWCCRDQKNWILTPCNLMIIYK